jgi:hypothetical protein
LSINCSTSAAYFRAVRHRRMVCDAPRFDNWIDKI